MLCILGWNGVLQMCKSLYGLASSLANKQTGYSHMVCSKAFWFSWSFLCEKRNQITWKSCKLKNIERVSYRCKNTLTHTGIGLLILAA